MTTRRRLVFNVPKGKERHYSKIPADEILGSVTAPLYHSYSYYMPSDQFDASQRKEVDEKLKLQTWINYKSIGMLMLPVLLFGWTSVWRCLVGGVVWAESESMFASWDGAVTFGPSHVSAHVAGFSLVSLIRLLYNKRASISAKALVVGLGFAVGSWDVVWHFLKEWAIHDNFSPVGDWHLIHRVDNVAHVGGILTGMLNAYYVSQSFKG